MKNQVVKFSIFFLSIVIFTNCKNEKNITEPVCIAETGKEISYQKDILPILVTNCTRCHASKNGSGGIHLEKYADVKFYCENGYLYESIRIRDNGTPAMPRGGRLSDCEISTIKTWIDQGNKNN